MSKKANPTVIGAFIVGGLALLVAGLIVFSSGDLFSKKVRYIMYFDEALNGLGRGARVQYRGITIGTVVESFIAHNQAVDDHSMPVIIEIDADKLRRETDRRFTIDDATEVKKRIDAGLRARLDAASFVTGLLQVQLEFVPNAPPPVYHQVKPEYLEIPTVRSSIQMLLADLGKVDLKGMMVRVGSILTHVDASLSELDVKAINAGITNLLESLNRVANSPDLTNSLTSLHTTLDNFGALAQNIDTNTLVQLQTTLTELHTTLQGVSVMTAPDSPVQHELTGALEQLNNAARAIAELTEFLKRNPNALITGRTPPKEKP